MEITLAVVMCLDEKCKASMSSEFGIIMNIRESAIKAGKSDLAGVPWWRPYWYPSMKSSWIAGKHTVGKKYTIPIESTKSIDRNRKKGRVTEDVANMYEVSQAIEI